MRWLFCLLSLLPFSLGDEQLRAVNVYGLETELAFQCGVSCCWANSNSFYVQKIADMGFNAIRLPFSAEYIKANDYKFMDEVIGKAEELNITIILDYHRTYANHQGNWYETNLQDFQNIWYRVLSHYYDHQNVKYVDLYNEFQDGVEKAKFWSDTMSSAILYLENIFPNRFIWVVGGHDWGGSLENIKVNVSAELDKRVMYTVHKYQWSVRGDYENDYRVSFGGYSGDKLFVGEFGWIQDNPQQRQWGEMFLRYLKEHNIRNTALWCMSYYSGDTQGILKPNCLDVETEKLQMLKNFWSTDSNHRTMTFRNHSHPTFLISSGNPDDQEVVLKYSPIPIPNDCYRLRGSP